MKVRKAGRRRRRRRRRRRSSRRRGVKPKPCYISKEMKVLRAEKTDKQQLLYPNIRKGTLKRRSNRQGDGQRK